jgi:hypothetical protein
MIKKQALSTAQVAAYNGLSTSKFTNVRDTNSSVKTFECLVRKGWAISDESGIAFKAA